MAMGFKAASYNPRIDPTEFVATVDNPYLPLVPGTTYKIIEKEGDETRQNDIVVTHDTRTIMGVSCVVVHDTVTIGGTLAEDTYDWFAQDNHGNVWYFGEDTTEYKPSGKVSTEGSWEAGVKGAKPGIVMYGQPKPGEPYRQEYLHGEAEDMGQVISLGQEVTVPFGHFTDCVRTKEWSLLESGSEAKWYCKGVGVVRTESTAGEVATLQTVSKE